MAEARIETRTVEKVQTVTEEVVVLEMSTEQAVAVQHILGNVTGPGFVAASAAYHALNYVVSGPPTFKVMCTLQTEVR